MLPHVGTHLSVSSGSYDSPSNCCWSDSSSFRACSHKGNMKRVSKSSTCMTSRIKMLSLLEKRQALYIFMLKFHLTIDHPRSRPWTHHPSNFMCYYRICLTPTMIHCISHSLPPLMIHFIFYLLPLIMIHFIFHRLPPTMTHCITFIATRK